MDFTNSQYLQLIAALVFGITLFVLVYRLPERSIIALLILLIPFQLVDSRYGSLNTVLTYLVAAAYFMQGRLNRLPLFGSLLLILFAYLLAFAQAHSATRFLHVLYLVNFCSNFLLFYLVYNFVRRTGEYKLIIRLLVILNVLVIAYCGLQLLGGDARFSFFSLDELAINPNREDGRLVGPFKATAATADYLSMQCILLLYLLLKGHVSENSRTLMWALLALNSLFLVTTGNRGGFVVLVATIPAFLFLFRNDIGFGKALKYVIIGSAIFSIGAAVAVGYTEYGRLFERLEETEMEGALPDTRSVAWPRAWLRFQEKPVFGHGPQLWITTRTKKVADIPYVQYPHNLFLHILYTIGIVGLVPWAIFFWRYVSKLLSPVPKLGDDELLAEMPKLGLVLFIAFMIGQVRIEFLREGLLDFQNYLFVLFALFLACTDNLATSPNSRPTKRGLGKSPGKDSAGVEESGVAEITSKGMGNAVYDKPIPGG